nr:hypothetical protein Iba_chr07cCG5110 [Ipomoea batatas]
MFSTAQVVPVFSFGAYKIEQQSQLKQPNTPNSSSGIKLWGNIRRININVKQQLIRRWTHYVTEVKPEKILEPRIHAKLPSDIEIDISLPSIHLHFSADGILDRLEASCGLNKKLWSVTQFRPNVSLLEAKGDPPMFTLAIVSSAWAYRPRNAPTGLMVVASSGISSSGTETTSIAFT